MSLNFVFDMDGTLIDSKQNIKPGVVEMLDCILKNCPNATFTIASGARYDQIGNTITKINACLKNGKITFNIIANAGALIYCGKKIIKNPITTDIHSEIFKIVQKFDDAAMFVYRAQSEDYNREPDDVRNQKRFDAIKDFAAKFGIFAYQLTSEEIEINIKRQDVLSLQIIPSKNIDKISEEIQTYASQHNLYVSTWQAIEISKLGKVEAMKLLFKELSLIKNQPINFKDVVYMGDGMNDIQAFETVGISFGVGDNLQVLKSATYAIENFEQATDYLFNNVDLNEISKARLQLLEQFQLAESYAQPKQLAKGLIKDFSKIFNPKKNQGTLNPFDNDKTESYNK